MAALPWSAGSPWTFFGIQGSVIPTVQGACRDYSFAMFAKLPFTPIIGKYALLISVAVRTFPLCPFSYRLLGGSNLTVARIVDNDSPFMKACDDGNLIAVRSMLQSGQGRPSDITDQNWNPLTVCVQQSGQQGTKGLGTDCV